MAGDWIKMRRDLHDDPSVIGICQITTLDEYQVVGRLHKLWAWADRQSRDGHAPLVTDVWIDRYIGHAGFSEAMEMMGWLEVNNGGVTFPNFDRHNGESAKKRALATERKREERSRNHRDESVTREEKRREEKKEQQQEVALRLPEWLPATEWKALLEVRKSKKAPNTPRALNLLVTELTRLKSLGFDPARVLDQSTLKGWKSVFPLKPELVAVTAEPKSQLCDYCPKISSGTVNGRRSCDEHFSRAMANERPARIAA